MGVMEMSEHSGDVVIRTMDWFAGSVIGCFRNFVNVGRIVLQKLHPLLSRAFLIRFFGSVPGVRNEALLIPPLRLLLGLPSRA